MASAASGAGAPCGVHRLTKLPLIDSICEGLSVMLETTAQELPSWDMSVVVSSSMYIPALLFQRRSLAAVLILSAVASHEATGSVSFSASASAMP